MLSRINSSLKNWEKSTNEEIRKNLENLNLENITEATIEFVKNIYKNQFLSGKILKIYTIHAFCQNILQKFPYEAGIKPNFSVIDEYKAGELLDESLYNLIDNGSIIEELNLLIKYSSIFRIKEILKDSVRYIKNVDSLEEKDLINFLQKKTNYKLENDLEYIKENFVKNIQFIIKKLNSEEKEIFLDISYKLLKKDIFEILSDSIELEEKIFYILKIFLTDKKTPRKNLIPKKNLSDEIFVNLINSAQEFSKNFIQEISSYEIISKNFILYKASYKLLLEYKKKKEENNFLDYEDLIKYCYFLVSSSQMREWVQYKLDTKIDHILVDEAQDTSFHQWSIIKSLVEDFLSGESYNKENKRSLFVVGDIKQSIYSFQGARPDLFEKMRKDLGKKFIDLKKNFVEINLSITYRLSPAIIDVVNDIFSKISKFGYTENQVSFRQNSYGKVEIWPVTYQEKSEKYFWPKIWEVNEQEEHQKILAKKIAIYIKENIDKKLFLNSVKRFANASDFLILVKKRTIFNSYLEQELSKLSIESAGADRIIVANHLSVKDILSAAKFSFDPFDDLNLASLLKSSLFELTDEDLLTIRTSNQDFLINQLKIYPKYQYILEKLDYIKNQSQNPSDKFFKNIIFKFQILEKLFSKNQLDAVDAIYEFINLTSKLSLHENLNIYEIYNYLTKNEISIKRELEDQNSVRIITVHGSKGLEAPVVILVDNISSKSPKDNFITSFDNNYPFLWVEGHYDNQSISLTKEINDKLEYEEYIRLLYVAMTRAKDILVVTASSSSSKLEGDFSNNSWYGFVRNNIDISKFKSEEDILYYEYGEIFKDDFAENSQHITKEIFIKISEITDFITQKEETDYPVSIFDLSTEYGTLFHKLLEDYVNSKDFSLIKNHYLLSNLDKEEKQEIISIIEKSINDDYFSEIIKNDLRTEFQVGENIDGKIRLYKLDLIVFLKDEIIIIDYKSDEKIFPIPEKYIYQLKKYKEIIENIYLNKKVSAKIFWIKHNKWYIVD